MYYVYEKLSKLSIEVFTEIFCLVKFKMGSITFLSV